MRIRFVVIFIKIQWTIHPGIIIDHIKKEYWWIDEEVDANSIGDPQKVIYMVRQRLGRVLQDLGQKKIQGRTARGLEIMLDGAQQQSELGPTSVKKGDGETDEWAWRNLKIEVWVDLKTNLPIEFRCFRRGEDFETTYRFTDLKWNVAFPDFDATVLKGYRELDKSPYSEPE